MCQVMARERETLLSAAIYAVTIDARLQQTFVCYSTESRENHFKRKLN